jgi:integrase
MAKKLTTKFVENLKPQATRVEIPDGGCVGLYLLLQPSGRRSWAARYRVNGRPAKLTLGQWPALSLHDARLAAAEALKQVRLGNDPARARQDAKIKADAATADTVTAIAESYIAREGKKLRTVDQRVSILRRLVYPHLGERPIGSIKRSDLVRMLDHIEDRNGPRAADLTLAVLRKIMNWHATRDDEFISPVVRGMGRQSVAEHRRTRTLSDGEIRKLWSATADGGPFGALVRFLLLTSARRNEGAAMRWDEVDANGVWTLPSRRSKTKVEVVRPLSGGALALLEGLPRIDGCPYPFTLNGRACLTNFSRPKAKLEAASGVANWRLHDLRRTARSLLSRAGINADISERCLGHALPGIRATYDRHRYLDEMRHGFEALASLIGAIVDPQDNILPLRR